MSVQTTSREARNDRRAAQERTADASRYLHPWRPEDDGELLLGPGTIAERAARLGRTYYAAQWRLTKLRKQLRDAERKAAA